ncbi:MAG: DNA-directed RNA polymerase subunit omega [Atribacterota bacterium]
MNILDNKYLLVAMVTKRADQLQAGAKPLVETKYSKPAMVALEEIKAGKVFLKEKKEPLKSVDVFHEEEDSVKMEEPVNPEDFSNEVEEVYEENEEFEDLFEENEESEELKGLFNGEEESLKPED